MNPVRVWNQFTNLDRMQLNALVRVSPSGFKALLARVGVISGIARTRIVFALERYEEQVLGIVRSLEETQELRANRLDLPMSSVEIAGSGPICCDRPLAKDGFDKNGVQRYYCKECKKYCRTEYRRGEFKGESYAVSI